MFEKLAKRKKLNIAVIVVGLFLIGYMIYGVTKDSTEYKPAPLASIMATINSPTKSEKIKEIRLEDAKRTITLVFKDKDKPRQTSSYTMDYGNVILKAADKNNIKVKINNQFGIPQTAGSLFIGFLPIVLIVGLLIWFAMSTIGGKVGSKPISVIPSVRFKDVAGLDEAVSEMGEITDFLNNTDRFRAIGATPPKGALLAGAPGCGKTLLAKAIAGETGVPFYHTSGSDFIELFVGLGARRVRTLFKAAKKHERSIIFIDEIDSIGGKRGSSDGADSREHNRTVNALLAEMDGFEESNVIVLAATNSPDSLDPALVRSGRFDRKIVIDLPDWKGREGILKIHAEGKPLADEVNLEVIAKTTTGLSGADLSNMVNEALINAVRNERDAANHEDFMEALSIVTLGRARTSSVITENDKIITALHEAGHAVVGLALEEIPDPSHVTIIPRGLSGGHTKLQEPEDRFQTSKALKARLAMMMGGFAAERLKLGDITQGPSSDLQQATELAQNMVSKMGMGDTLTVVADQSILVNSSLSEAVRAQAEILIAAAVDRATAVLNEPKWRIVFEKMSEKLLEFDSIESDEIQELKKVFGAKEVK